MANEAVKVVLERLVEFLKGYFRTVEQIFALVGLGGFRVTLGINFDDGTNVDERIRKIEIAKENLQDALEAINSLSLTADENKRQLREALDDLDQAENKRASLENELAQIRQIATADVATFRKLAGISPIRDQIVGFVAGIIASIVASLLLLGVAKIF